MKRYIKIFKQNKVTADSPPATKIKDMEKNVNQKKIEVHIGDYTDKTRTITLEELKKELSTVPMSSRYFFLDNLSNAGKITDKEYDWLL